MTASSGHKEHLQKSLEWIKRIKTKEKKSPPCLEGWQISINAVMMLWDKLHSEHEFRFLLTNRLNKDCVGNLFSIIRAKGAQRDNPDAGQFRAAFRQVMVDMVMIPSKGGNYEEEVDKFICTLENINKSAPPSLAPTPEEPSIMDTIPWNVKSILSVFTLPTKDEESLTYQETNVLAYIASYIVHKIKGKVCSSCTEKFAWDSRYKQPVMT